MSIKTFFEKVKAWWENTTIGQEVDKAAEAAKSEIDLILPADLKIVVETTVTALLTAITASNSTAAVISAGIGAAEEAFKSVGASVASTTLSTFVSTLHNTVVTQVPEAKTA
jgi:hypothetical protein